MRPQRFRLALHFFLYYTGACSCRYSEGHYRENSAYDIKLRWWHPVCMPLVAVLAIYGFCNGIRLYVIPELMSEVRECFGEWMGPNTIPLPKRTRNDEEKF